MPASDYIFISLERLSFDAPVMDKQVEAQWNDWNDETYVRQLCDVLGAHTATRWRVVSAGSPAWYAGIYEIEDRPLRSGQVKAEASLGAIGAADVGMARRMELLQRETVGWWHSGKMHPRHKTMSSALVRPFAYFDPVRKIMAPEPTSAGASQRLSPKTNGLSLTFSSSNNPAKEADWDAWYRQTHSPLAIATGAFMRATRCERVLPEGNLGGLEMSWSHLTLYDIEMAEPEKAGAVFPPHLKEWDARGLMHPNHTGGPSFSLRPHGKWAAKGYRHGA